MIVILIRSVILYTAVIFAVRLMGKRQLGELQPSELVITILVSNIATLPLEDTDIPMIIGMTPILSLICCEVIVSYISLNCPKIRKLISGSPKIIISSGKIDRHTMKELRLSVDDLMTGLRSCGVFDISDVQFAVVETTGSISVMKKPENSKNCSDPPLTVISDGEIQQTAVEALGIDLSDVMKQLKKEDLKPEQVFIMTADSENNFYIIKKDKEGKQQ